MLTETLIRLCGSTADSGKNLKAIETALEQTNELGDIRTVKARLAEQLGRMQLELDRQRDEYSHIDKGLRENLKKSPLLVRINSTDAVTGLEDRRSAISAIENITDTHARSLVAVFSIENLDLVNNRYGFGVGDSILLMFSQHLAQHLPQDRLFRWRGPTFMGLIDRNVGFEQIRKEIQKLNLIRLEHNVESNARSVLLPITWSWTVIRADSLAAGAIVTQIDKFVSQKSIAGEPD